MITIRTLETPLEMEQAEQLQALVWPGSDMDVVPGHMMLTAAHNGGLVLGAYEGEKMVGMLFGFVGLYDTPDGQRPKHCSHRWVFIRMRAMPVLVLRLNVPSGRLCASKIWN